MKKILLLVFLGGCMLGPNYQEPEQNFSDGWTSEADCEAPKSDWWTVFEDPLLTKYIEAACVCNKDVLAAEANILEARALRMVTASDLFPHIGADVAAGGFQFSKNGIVFGPAAATGKSPKAESLYSGWFDAIWELDLFGKTRRSVEAAGAMIGSQIEQRNNILISVFAEIALNYIEVRSFQKQWDLTERNIRVLEQQAAIVERQFQLGYVSLLKYETILASLATAKAALPDILANIYRNIYAVSVLTGCVPEALFEELVVVQPLPKAPEVVAVGLRSDLLRRRPDIRKAERELAAATANIGVAVASFFPSISLGGIDGLQSLQWNKFFKSDSNIWIAGGNASVPIFEGGKLVGNLRLNEASAESAYQTYQQTVLKALEETESAIITLAQERKSEAEFQAAVFDRAKITSLSLQRFEKGIANKVDYLQSELDLISAEQSLLTSDTRVLVDVISLYKALGGKW